jgi:hypothetical protein
MPAATPAEVLAERYGRAPAPERRRLLVVLGALLAVAGIGWVVWSGWSHSYQEVDGELRGYSVVSDTETEVSVLVDRRTGTAVECEVYAQADDHSRVGELVLEVPAGDPGQLVVTESITTQRRAVNGVLGTCRAAAD